MSQTRKVNPVRILVGPVELLEEVPPKQIYVAKVRNGVDLETVFYDAIIDLGRSQRRPSGYQVCKSVMPREIVELKRR